MKFCKNLQRLVDISDPEWAPYWINYKMLKKLIKELPSSVPSINNDVKKTRFNNMDNRNGVAPSSSNAVVSINNQRTKDDGFSSEDEVNKVSSSRMVPSPERTLEKMLENDSVFQTRSEVIANLSVSKTASSTPLTSKEPETKSNLVKTMGGEPSEVAFFKLLHSEVKKGIHFFSKAEQEFMIREERIREGAEILKNSDRIMSSDRWSNVATSLYRLYKDLLLLETYAVMSYCSFSKILKKHDKVTGHSTRMAFMSNVVAKTNFSNYPNLLKMISRCEALYEEVSQSLVLEGKECLQEDERLFINMIIRVNEQAIDVADEEDVPITSKQKDKNKKSVIASSILRSRFNSSLSPTQGKVTSSSKTAEGKYNQMAALVANKDSDVKGSKRSQHHLSHKSTFRLKRTKTENEGGA